MNFLDNYFNGFNPHGKIFIANPSLEPAIVNITSPLITSGLAMTSLSLNVSVKDVEEVSLSYTASLDGTGRENKGSYWEYC